VFICLIYRVIQIHDEFNGIESVVNDISSLFVDINISILYINTYNNDIDKGKEL